MKTRNLILTLGFAFAATAAQAQSEAWVWQNGWNLKTVKADSITSLSVADGKASLQVWEHSVDKKGVAGSYARDRQGVDSVSFVEPVATKPQYRDFDVNGVTLRMVYVQGGSYYRGAQDTDPAAVNYVTDSLHYDHEANDHGSEQPIYRVNMTDFYMEETECTQRVWKALYPQYSYFGIKGDDYPANGQYHSEVLAFIDSLNNYLHHTNQIAVDEKFSLPTESQWEWAARGGVKSKGYRYAGSDDIDEVAWYSDNSKVNGHMTLHEVKGKKPNELGLYDMSGNAIEVCSDNFWDDYSWAKDNETDPTGYPEKTALHWASEQTITRRGGGWAHPAFRQTVTKRDFHDISSDVNQGASEDVGFRLILK